MTHNYYTPLYEEIIEENRNYLFDLIPLIISKDKDSKKIGMDLWNSFFKQNNYDHSAIRIKEYNHIGEFLSLSYFNNRDLNYCKNKIGIYGYRSWMKY